MATAKKSTKKSAAGRKPAADPKKNVQFYIENSIINAVGGMEAARDLCIKALWDKRYEKER